MNRKIEEKNLFLFCIISIIIIITIFTFNLSSGRYIGEIVAEDDVIAIPIFTLSNNSKTYSISNMLPGETKEYTFSVSNTDGKNISEISLSYYFEINIDAEFPLEVKLYDITSSATGEEIQITNNTTNKISLNKTKQEKTYKLKLYWDELDNNYEYSGNTINCNIKLVAEQVI